ncbi:MAG: hypothetical protein RBQ97_01130 [Acholeplasma sp.]|nr:hypothetical protein [Acholeplasma sp.]
MLKFNTKINIDTISTKNLNVELLKSGDIYRIYNKDIEINLLKSNLFDGSVANLYLRKKVDGVYLHEKLLGIKSNSSFVIDNKRVIYQGEALGVKYQVILNVEDDGWFYDCLLDKKSDDSNEYELFYGQDVGVAPRGMIQSSESYTGQYIDHKIFESSKGFTVLSRQNQGITNLVQIGSLDKNVAYSTDGFQFFGLSYKKTDVPEILTKEQLYNKNYQYEFPYIALQSEKFSLKDQQKSLTFYGKYIENYEEIRTKPFEVVRSSAKSKEYITGLKLNKIANNIKIGSPLVGLEFTNDEILKLYPKAHNIEKDGEEILSLFDNRDCHVVLQAKELKVERPNGHIIIHGDILHASENVMASTAFFSGIFASHIVLGNTNFHKLNGDVRNMLNVQKIAGLRIYLNEGNEYHLLTMPSLFEIRLNRVKWIYKLGDDELVIEYVGLIDKLQQTLLFKSKNNKKYNILITNPIIMGEVENTNSLGFTVKENKEIIFDVTKNEMVFNHYPNLKYCYIFNDEVEIHDDQIFFNHHAQNGMMVLKYNDVNRIDITLLAGYNESFNDRVVSDLGSNDLKAYEFFHKLVPLTITSDNDTIKDFNDLVIWYTHNALVHYSSPHGLEQFNGAAWGTRDVCQGPFELFITAQRYDLAKEILLKTFSRQFIENGDFPQWFMFDKYFRIQAHDSHGDIIVWPLKALGHYIEVTDDYNILNEKVPFMSIKDNDFTIEAFTIYEHIQKIYERLDLTRIVNMPFPAYGGGDWDDTLQPANHELTNKMVSVWTVSLLIQALEKIIKYLPNDNFYEKIVKYYDEIKSGYYKYLIKDGVPPGFTIFDDDKTSVLIHPSDNITGLKYRLLSFNRGIIAELFDKERIKEYLKLIDQNLKHPDGVRLIDNTIKYNGGKKTYFMRAETAANFGREIGLQYVHAHIRYIEAMSKINRGDRALEGLLVISPFSIKKHVKNALIRQSNTYFSSSDGFFFDRYEARKDFDLLRTGNVLVKAGWRVYSSGPGIYLNQLISNVLGILVVNNDLVISPVVDNTFDKATLQYQYFGKPVTINYLADENKKGVIMINQKKTTYKKEVNKYGKETFTIDKKTIKSLNEIVIDYFF